MNYKTRSGIHIRDERYPRSYVQRPAYVSNDLWSGPYIFCARSRCDSRIELVNTGDGLKYPANVIVVSEEDGDRRYAYCSNKCVASAYTSKYHQEEKARKDDNNS